MEDGGARVMAGSDLLERDTELERIDDALAVAAGSHGGALLLIEGAAGTGKTRLIDSAEESAASRGFRVLKARCSELEAAFSFGVVLQLFEPVLTELGPPERERLLAGGARLCAPLFAHNEDAGDPFSPADLSFPVIHGLYWLIVSLTSESDVVLLIDDAHWCDEASLRFLAYVARRLDGLRLAMVLTAREAPLGGERSAAFDELGAVASRTVLRPLSETAVATLVHEELSQSAAPEFCASCAHATGGNPFLLHELLTELRITGFEASSAEAARVGRLVPPSVLQAIMARIGRLPAGSIDVARAAAVLGRRATLQRCALVAEMDPARVGIAADALTAAGVFDVSSPTTFRHPLIQSAVHEDMPGSARARAHARAAFVLHEQGEPVQIIAAHLMETDGGSGERWAIDVLRRAAKAALAGGDSREAVGLLDRARAEGLPPDLRAAVLSELGQAQSLSAHPQALDTLQEALDHTTDPIARAMLHRRRGDLLFSVNRSQEAFAEYGRGIAGLDAGSAEARELEAARAVVMFLLPGGIDRAAANVESISAQEEGADTPAERGLLAQLSLQAALTGQPRDQVRALALRAWGSGALLEEEGPDGHLWTLVTGALSFAGFFEESVAIIDRVISAARDVGSVLAFAMASYGRSAPLYWSGRIAEAAADAQLALDARKEGWSAWVGSASLTLSRCLIERGELEEAAAALADPDDPRWAQSIEGLTVLLGRAWLHLARGANDEALADYLTLGDRCESAFGVRSPVIMPWHNGAALAALRLGDLQRAVECHSAGMELARAFGAPGPIGRSLVIGGLIETVCGRTEKGLELLFEAVSALEGTEAGLDHLYALVELGSALRRANRRTDARAPLATASELAGRMGATALEQRATSELVATGARPRRKAVTGVDALTPSESRIAALAAGGLTNRQVAEHLFITPKAVEFHLANTFRKLQIQNRRQLATALAS